MMRLDNRMGVEICLNLLDIEMGPAAKPQCDGHGQGKEKKRHEKLSDHLGRPPSTQLLWTGSWCSTARLQPSAKPK